MCYASCLSFLEYGFGSLFWEGILFSFQLVSITKRLNSSEVTYRASSTGRGRCSDSKALWMQSFQGEATRFPLEMLPCSAGQQLPSHSSVLGFFFCFHIVKEFLWVISEMFGMIFFIILGTCLIETVVYSNERY